MAIDWRYTPEQDAFRGEVRAWLGEHVPRQPLRSLDTPEGAAEHRLWERSLQQARWAVVTWPKEYGGRGSSLLEWLIFEEEYYRADAPGRINQNGIFLLGPTLIEFGTPEQKRIYLPRMASSEDVWAQAWSEPQAGSDLAALRATARREGDHYVLRGHKIWSSRAALADWAFGLFRTDPQSEGHRGISFILFPLRHEGVRVRPIRQIGGQAGFAEIHLEEARVPVANRVGDEGKGWQIAMATAGLERGLMLRSPARFQRTAARLASLYCECAATAEPGLASLVAQAWIDAEAYTLHTYMTAARLMSGDTIGAEASLNKIFWSEMDLAMHRTAMSLLGAQAELTRQISSGSAQPVDSSLDAWREGFLFSLAGPIYAGSNEIQRNIIAERLLHMPRE
jgi:alkylation response protein AidB-like acyl-CoA dehydrogenase